MAKEKKTPWWKKALGKVGSVAKFAAPVLAMTGIGAPLAAGIGALGSGLSRLDDPGKYNWKGALGDAALSGGASMALGGKGGLNLGGKAWDKIRGIGANAAGKQRAPGRYREGDVPGQSAAYGGGGGGNDFLRSLGGGAVDLIKNKIGLGRPGGLDLSDLLLGGAGAWGAVAANKNQGKSDKLVEEAVGRNRDEYAATAPLRDSSRAALMARLQGAMQPTATPDTSGLQNKRNPFRKQFSFQG